MKAMLINAGNTHIKVVAWSGGAQAALVDPARGPVALDQIGAFGSALVGGDIRQLECDIQKLHEAAGKPQIVLVSVLPDLDAHLSGIFTDLILIDHRSDLPFELGVEKPQQVGPDRLCNVAAAVSAGLRDAIVVDAGTATTFDLLQDGVFAGGIIAPGMAFAAARLGIEAARLRPVPFGPVDLELGRNTREAMAQGAWHAGVGGVEHIIEGLLQLYGARPVILTGGLGHHLQADDRYHDRWWTLRGAAHLAGLD